MEKLNTTLLIILLSLSTYSLLTKPKAQDFLHSGSTISSAEVENRDLYFSNVGQRFDELHTRLSEIQKQLDALGIESGVTDIAENTGPVTDRSIENERGHALVSGFIERGSINQNDLARLHQIASAMDPAEQEHALRMIVTAINDQRVSFEPGTH